jgi:hypothetical protein
MKKRRIKEEPWEAPSLEWIHRVRRERQRERKEQPPRPLSRKAAERLAKRHGLKLAR